MTASIGIGGGTIMIALMSYFLPIAALIPVHGVVQFGSNTGRAAVMRKHVDWTRLMAFSIGAIVGAGLGAAIAVRLSGGTVLTGLGLFVIASTWIKLPRLAAIRQTGMALIGAAITSAQHGFKTIGFALAGFAFAPWLPLILLMILSGFVGTLAGAHILNRLPERGFRLAFKLMLTALALDMIYRGIQALL